MRPASTLPLLALLALVIASGCISPSGTTGSPTTVAETDTPSTTVTERDAPPTTGTSTPPDVTAENTVDYDSLTPPQRAAADAAFQRQIQFVPDSPYVGDDEGFNMEHMDPFRNNEYLRYDGSYYVIELTMSGDLYASYGIDAVPEEPGENDTVVSFDEVPDEVRDEVRDAIEAGSHYVPSGKWDSLPQPLSDMDYVRYENQTYRLEYVVGDYWAHELRLTRAE